MTSTEWNGSDRFAVGMALLREANAELVRVSRTRGASRRTARRRAHALAMAALAATLLGIPLAEAATPIFFSPFNPFGISNVGTDASPVFADIDGDGDLDAFVGESFGNTLFFANTGTASAAAFAAPVANPFGLSDAGNRATPEFADIDGDGDLDAFVGALDGNTLFFANTGTASAAAFAAAVTNPFGLSDVGYYATPAFADIDGDGDLDAFVGEFYGNTLFFANTGTASAAAFAAAVTNPFGLSDVGSRATPAFADIDGDGDLDVFVGEYYGDTILFENRGTASTPLFAAAFTATNPFGLSDVGDRASPAFADIDGDGDLDAFVGESFGNTLFFANTGTASAAALVVPPTNSFGLSDVGSRATPEFADIDGDGDLDAFVGEFYGNTIFFANTGTASAAGFAAAVANPFGLSDVGFHATPAFADIDGDGDLDAFVGEYLGNTLFFANTGTASAAAFAAPVANPFGLSDVGNSATPAFADIDGDGDLDAFVGALDGNTLFFANTGAASAPAFAAAVTNSFGLSDVGSYASPELADVDGDGDLDAFVGEYFGNTLFFANTGTASAPAFAAAVTNPFGLADVGDRATPALTDLDADGDLDAFIGRNDGRTLFFENIASVPDCNGFPATTGCTVNAVPGQPCTGTGGDDVIIGTAGPDVIVSGAGADEIHGANGQDLICAGDGDDEIFGEGGSDTIFAEDGTDTVAAGQGSDEVDGGAGDDALSGNGGNDTLLGQAGEDTLLGSTGLDTLDGGADDDVLSGGNANDVLAGGTGNDQIDGGFGLDVITGGNGNDVVNGGRSADTIDGNAGNDTLNGQGENDDITGGTGTDTLTGGSGNDDLNGGSDTDSCDGGTQTTADSATNCETVTNVP